ncbi:MAG: hypothetical protein ACI8RZ_007291 [Myxococcota bacterium]|jgi:hypothetical protein
MIMSESRTRRLGLMFDIYDTDGSGAIERGDFALRAQRRVSEAGFEAGSIEARRLTNSYLAFYDGLAGSCDLNGNGQIVKDEWVAVWDELSRIVQTFEELPVWVVALADAIWTFLTAGEDTAERARLEAGHREPPFHALLQFFGERTALERADFEAWWMRYLFADEV